MGYNPPALILDGNLGVEEGSFAGSRLDFELSAKHLNSFPHAEESEAARECLSFWQNTAGTYAGPG